MSQPKNQIPVLYGVDAIHGATYTSNATLFPQELGLAATWNPDFAEKTGSVTAYEIRASAIPWNFSPVLDLGRQPLWSRFFETFGEDPYLATQMGNAIVKGYQGDNIGHPEKVAACLKHYVGYSFPFTGKDRTPILMPERLLREYYLVPFKEAIDNGAVTVMINSSEINGTPVHANYHILTEILKQELKFEGFAVSDWEDIKMLYNTHKVAATEKEAVMIAVNAGVDMSMVPYDYSFCTYLVELVKEGKVKMERIDDAVRRILRVKAKLGLFENTMYPLDKYPKFGSEEFANYSYQAALESVTLLKNRDSVLPLPKTAKVLVTGPGANSLNYLNGAWTHTWQGVDPRFNTPGKKTTLDAIRDEIGAGNVTYVEGCKVDADTNTSKAVMAARSAQYIIVCLTEAPSTEKPGDIADLNFPEAQLNLVKELSKTGKPIILVLTEARPRIFNKVDTLASGVLMAYLPGNEGGRAIAEILFGDANPSGKLPFTYPRHTGSLCTYDHKFCETKDINFGFKGVNPQYEFGFGLSYTSFKYSDLKISKDTIGKSDTLNISIKVANTGQREGKEVVQIYTKDLYASITPSVKRLKRFSKISLKPGESKTVSFKITPADLAFVNNENKWITEPGQFEVLAGGMIAPFYYKE
ncbi:MAG: glycoside hydrolase family 3 C-terminal domain-containing protein [Cytophagaceae bacterium]|nr:glycoside hydrolase family 3 C-terminal domain-containing protein [Cytophagaceae bacterium]